MQSHNDDQRTTESNPDWRRDAEQSAVQDADGLALPPSADMGNRTVCLSASLSGKGGATA